MRKEHKVFAVAFESELQAIAGSGYYSRVKSAEQYIERQFGDLWRSVVWCERDDIGICDVLEMTDTMKLIVHLFGRTAHNHGNSRSKAPRITTWMPTVVTSGTGGAEATIAPHAIPKRWIARLVGKSESAVNAATSALRGKGSPRGARGAAREKFFLYRLAFPNFIDTGIMLDLMVEANLSFDFMRCDYEYAKRFAIDARLNDADVNRKQIEWCDEAIRNKDGDAVPALTSEAAANDATDRQRRGSAS